MVAAPADLVVDPVRRPDCVFCPTSDSTRRIGRRTRPVWGKVKSHVSYYGATKYLGIFAVFEPLNPVVPGHLLVVPDTHVRDAAEDPDVAAGAMEVAATIAQRYTAANIITSIGADATQSVFHLHAHVVPRRPGDGLLLPWSGQ